MPKGGAQLRVASLLAAVVAWAAPSVCAQESSLEPREYEFYGSFDQTSVQLGGRGLAELFSACTEYLRTSGLDPIDQLSVEDRHFVRRTGYFDRDQACALVVLNARPPGPELYPEAPLLIGALDGVPFRLWEPREEALEAARTYLPLVVRGLPVATVIVDGRHHAHAGPWSVEEVVALVEQHLDPSAPPSLVERGPDPPWTTVGARAAAPPAPARRA